MVPSYKSLSYKKTMYFKIKILRYDKMLIQKKYLETLVCANRWDSGGWVSWSRIFGID